MASIITRPNGRREIRWIDADENQKQISLGRITKRDAQTIKLHVGRLDHAQKHGMAPPPDTNEVSETLHQKLERAGLIGMRDRPEEKTLEDLLDWYTEDRGKTRKGRTVEVWEQGMRSLTDYFGEDKLIANMSEGDAESWREWMLTTPATN